MNLPRLRSVFWLALVAIAAMGTARAGIYAIVRPDSATIRSAPGPTVLFFFGPTDCTNYRSMVTLIEEWHATGVPVLAVPLGDSVETAAKPRVPIRFDLADRTELLALRMGYWRTPLLLVLDGGGRVTLALPAEANPTVLQAYDVVVRETFTRRLRPATE